MWREIDWSGYPSVDPSDSKDLPAHQAIALADMAVLEGVVLDAVQPGLYTLIALPLRIENGDASPLTCSLLPTAAFRIETDKTIRFEQQVALILAITWF